MADQRVWCGPTRAGAKGALLRDLMLLIGLIAALALVLIGWGAWRLDSGRPLPEWLGRLAVISGLLSGEQLALAARGADERRTADALSRNEVANRARAVNGVRAAAWDGDRLIVMLAPGLAPTGLRAKEICRAVDAAAAADPVRVRLEALDGKSPPVESWCAASAD